MSRTEQADSCTRARRWTTALLSLVAACSGSEPGSHDRPDAAARRAVEDASSDAPSVDAASPILPPAEPTLDWHRTTLPLDPDGRTPVHTLTFPAGARTFAVRSSLPQPAPHVCFQLEDVSHGTIEWVGRASTEDYGDYCLTCRERVAAGSGYGFHVLPSGADDVGALEPVRLRVALRDCATLTPLSAADARSGEVILEHTAWSPPPTTAALRLPLSIVIASEHAIADDPSLLPRALETLRDAWSPAGIQIEVAATVSIDVSAGPISYAADDRSALVALTTAARDALEARGITAVWPTVVLTRCLQRNDVLTGGRSEPLATTPHIPGGFGLGAEPDSILVAAERCGGLRPGPRFLDPSTLGAILAHELGHYLGLFHVRESDGRADSLPDTGADTPNLMQLQPDPVALTLTHSQMRVARRHPIFAEPSRFQQP